MRDKNDINTSTKESATDTLYRFPVNVKKLPSRPFINFEQEFKYIELVETVTARQDFYGFYQSGIVILKRHNLFGAT